MPYKGGCAFQPLAIEIGDVRIGAVEIQDQTTNRRANVITDAGQDRLAVQASIAGAAAIGINANQQLQNIETVVPLAGGATWTGDSRDLLNFAGLGVSVYVARDTVDTLVQVLIQDSHDNATWRTRETVELPVTAAAPGNGTNRLFSPTRRYMRVVLVNTTANGLSVTEVVTMQKPIP